MNDIRLTKTRLASGIWEGVISYSGEGNFQPSVTVTHLETPIHGVSVTEDRDAGHWLVRIEIPVDTISDGVQTFLILDDRDASVLGSFALLAGDGMAEDIRSEMDLLRAELDMLKKAFRRHCVETLG